MFQSDIANRTPSITALVSLLSLSPTNIPLSLRRASSLHLPNLANPLPYSSGHTNSRNELFPRPIETITNSAGEKYELICFVLLHVWGFWPELQLALTELRTRFRSARPWNTRGRGGAGKNSTWYEASRRCLRVDARSTSALFSLVPKNMSE